MSRVKKVTFLPTLHGPIFSDRDGHFGNGIVGSPLISIDERSRKAANAAVRILRGEAPADIQIPPVGFSTPKFDWREMLRWGISEKNLPPGSEIHFRPPAMWERYRVQILTIAVAFLAQAMLISWLVYLHRRRHLAEILSRNAMTELTYMNRMATGAYCPPLLRMRLCSR